MIMMNINSAACEFSGLRFMIVSAQVWQIVEQRCKGTPPAPHQGENLPGCEHSANSTAGGTLHL